MTIRTRIVVLMTALMGVMGLCTGNALAWTHLGGDPLVKSGVNSPQAVHFLLNTPLGVTAMKSANLSPAEIRASQSAKFSSCNLNYGMWFLAMTYGSAGTEFEGPVQFLDKQHRSSPAYCATVLVRNKAGNVTEKLHELIPSICANFGLRSRTRVKALPVKSGVAAAKKVIKKTSKPAAKVKTTTVKVGQRTIKVKPGGTTVIKINIAPKIKVSACSAPKACSSKATGGSSSATGGSATGGSSSATGCTTNSCTGGGGGSSTSSIGICSATNSCQSTTSSNPSSYSCVFGLTSPANSLVVTGVLTGIASNGAQVTKVEIDWRDSTTPTTSTSTTNTHSYATFGDKTASAVATFSTGATASCQDRITLVAPPSSSPTCPSGMGGTFPNCTITGSTSVSAQKNLSGNCPAPNQSITKTGVSDTFTLNSPTFTGTGSTLAAAQSDLATQENNWKTPNQDTVNTQALNQAQTRLNSALQGCPTAPPAKFVKITSVTDLNDIPAGQTSPNYFVGVSLSDPGVLTVDPGNSKVNICGQGSPQSSLTINVPAGDSQVCLVFTGSTDPAATSTHVIITASIPGSGVTPAQVTDDFAIKHPVRT